MKVVFALLFALVIVGDVSAEDADAKAIRAMVPAASGMQLADLDKLATSTTTPKASDLASQTLTLTLLTIRITEQDKRLDEEFRYLERTPKPSDLAQEVSRNVRGAGRLRVALGPVTMIQADRIKECTCKVDGDKASGTVSFEVPNLYAGKVDYVARRMKETWRIEEFILPVRQIRITRSDKGTWVRTESQRKKP